MADLHKLRDKITSTIYPNGKGAINAADHQALLLDMVDTIGNAIEENAGEVRADGNYPNMSVGFAANLIGRGESIASEIGFRASGGKSIEDGSARITELQGNAVVWNQLINESKLVASDASITKTAIGYTITPSGGAAGLKTDSSSGGVAPVVGHKYALLCVKIGGTKGLYLNWGGYNASLPNPIFSATDSTKKQLTIYSYNETETFTLTTPRLVDLTLMFGSGNEPTTIADFYNRMPQCVNVAEYNEGQLIASNADGIKSVGFNAWDGQWEVGQINVMNGEAQTSSNTIRSKNFCDCLPNETYYAYCAGYSNEYYLGIVWYDADYNYIGFNYAAGRTRQAPSNARYFKLTTNTSSQVNYGTSYNNDICINLVHSGYKNGTYQPYMEYVKKFDSRIFEAFPNGMMPWDKVYNKNGKGYVVIGTKLRAYENGDAYSETMVTDGKTTILALANPTIYEYKEPFNLDFEVWDFGTEEMLASEPSAPIKAMIRYQFNAVDEVRELRQMIATLQATIANLQ